MIRSFDKKNLVIILFLAAVFLLLLNVLIIKLYPPVPEKPELKEISAEAVSTRFRNAIMNYGFEEEWIVTKKSRQLNAESSSYQIKVPKDVPIALLIKEINDSFSPEEAEIIVEEKKINGINTIKIFSNGELKLSSDFTYSKDISRKAAHCGTLLLNPELLSEDEMNIVLGAPEHFGIVVIPSSDNILLAKKISSTNKEIAVLLNDEISELKFKLGPDYSLNRIKDVLRTVIGSFPAAVFFIIDSNSSIYNSKARDIIESEFTKRNIKLLPSKEMLVYKGNDGENFKDVIAKMNNNSRLITVPAQQYTALNPEIDRLRKVGFKFVKPSVILSENQTVN